MSDQAKGLEHIMQYMWRWRLYGDPDKHLIDGRPVRIVNPGQLNNASGPDFFNARVDIDSTSWAGNVELHLRASDWHRHGHHKDKAYDSVILHVVGYSDSVITRADGSAIPQLLLPFTEHTAELYSILSSGNTSLRCGRWLRSLPRLHINDWIESAGMERLQEKADRIDEYVKFTGGDWSRATFIVLARALGFGLNSEPFERLARGLPMNVMARHADSQLQLDALMLGYAGLLAKNNPPSGDDYYAQIRDEYAFLAHKYQLKTLPAEIWKMSGSRPQNMPYRKLALLARLSRGVSSIFSRIIDARGDYLKLMELFDVRFDGYWEHHLTIGTPTARSYKVALSEEMIRVLLINVVAPIYHAYGRSIGDLEIEEMGYSLWTQLPGERNAVMKMWAETANLQPRCALQSQALLHIWNQYCKRSECLHCRAGHKLLRVSVVAGNN